MLLEEIKIDNNSTLKEYGIISIKSSNNGIVSSVTHQAGDFVPEGMQICQINAINSLVFKLQVPYEYNDFIKTGQNCRIKMANGKIYSGIINKELAQMSFSGQTIQYLVKPVTNEFIPENLLAIIEITIRNIKSNQILPLECLLSDEMMQNFWIMKLINDSVAVKVKVKPGLKNKKEVEIIDPIFNSSDLILSSGNYGLNDTALVRIQN